jgi:phosphoglucomutase
MSQELSPLAGKPAPRGILVDVAKLLVAYADLKCDLAVAVQRVADAPANQAQKQALAKLTPKQITPSELADEPIVSVADMAPGDDAPIDGIKVSAKSGWFAARPSGTEDNYNIYAESFRDDAHLRRLLEEAQRIVDTALVTKEKS